MRIQIINPNTTQRMTQQCLMAGRAVAAAGTELVAFPSASGTPSVESHFDEAVAGLGVAEQVLAGASAGVDAYVIACFGDTGLGMARELCRAPVVGMTEAAIYAAALIAPVFSIITLPSRTRIFAERALWQAGFERRCARVRAIDVAVLDLATEETATLAAMVIEGRRAIAEDHAEAIVLGCAGLQALVEPLRAALGVPVVEGVAAAVKMAEALLGLGLATSKRGEFAFPPAKGMTGPAATLQLPWTAP